MKRLVLDIDPQLPEFVERKDILDSDSPSCPWFVIVLRRTIKIRGQKEKLTFSLEFPAEGNGKEPPWRLSRPPSFELRLTGRKYDTFRPRDQYCIIPVCYNTQGKRLPIVVDSTTPVFVPGDSRLSIEGPSSANSHDLVLEALGIIEDAPPERTLHHIALEVHRKLRSLRPQQRTNTFLNLLEKYAKTQPKSVSKCKIKT
jgi:hypothetical protein